MTTNQRQTVNKLRDSGQLKGVDQTFILKLYYSKPNYELSIIQNALLLEIAKSLSIKI